MGAALLTFSFVEDSSVSSPFKDSVSSTYSFLPLLCILLLLHVSASD